MVHETLTEISIKQAQKLLRSIKTSDVVGMRDRAVLSALAYTGERIHAVANLRVADLCDLGEECVLRFKESAKSAKFPVRHEVERWLREFHRNVFR